MKRRADCRQLILTLSLSILFAGAMSFAFSQIRTDQFEEVTQAAGIHYVGESYGVAWGDYNGDGWPDLWLGNHVREPNFYRNNRDGTFTEVTHIVRVYDMTRDTHGPAWADFDNDGDEDMIELVGAYRGNGLNPKFMYVNETDENGQRVLRDRAVELGLAYEQASARTPLWFDADGDGRLDVLMHASRGTVAFSALFHQIFNGSNSSFENANVLFGFAEGIEGQFSILSDLSGDGRLDLIVDGDSYPERVYDITTVPFRDITHSIGLTQTDQVKDAVCGDFNGDLLNELFVIRTRRPSDLVQVSPYRIEAGIYDASGTERGFSFRASGSVLFELHQHLRSRQVLIGQGGWNPTTLPNVTLSPDDPNVWGIKPHTAGVDEGVFIGYDTATQSWTVLFSTPGNNSDLSGETRVGVAVNTQQLATDLVAINLDTDPQPMSPIYYLNTGTGFVDRTDEAGLRHRIWARSIGCGDLDNDGDLDLYLVCTEPVLNIPNVLYENLGDGTFRRVPNAAGAAGSLDGRGDGVALADYNCDGFLDMVLMNGQWPQPFSDDGPTQLFRNRGNSNRWIQMDLLGRVSNPHGIGARVVLTANGRPQLREQGGGMHFRCQNHRRLHFGLGSANLIDSIKIDWPSGIHQELYNVPVNQILSITERRTGDTDFSGCVDDTDLANVIFAFGQVGASDEDLNYDGIVDDTDLATVILAFGEGC